MPHLKRLFFLSFVLLLPACGGAEAPEAPEAPAVTDTAMTPAAPAPAAAPAAKVNLNTADRAAFLALPGVTERMAHEFEEYRPYVSIRQFRREIGKYVDADQVAAYEQHVFVPIGYNESDAETVQQIPGLDAAAAQALVDGRPYASADAFLQAVEARAGAAARAAAQGLLKAE